MQACKEDNLIIQYSVAACHGSFYCRNVLCYVCYSLTTVAIGKGVPGPVQECSVGNLISREEAGGPSTHWHVTMKQ